ncbi:dermonecrotic toxin domain-containing protein [Pseudomonas sp. KU43P]|uniref:dermonecrotic toxin domain-containing protein n=1 Tax=Pseudomonas sp. KU43P TaxID=2487887 RepID=UPI0012A9443B|nr:DUF6543 domain-containing protein [Pseudomonas sp. KU43P]BBH43862.1 hypothetical protein KU43P_03390 [Pseudomonas sp. KU43P]
MANPTTSIFDFKYDVAAQFADRPTLRQVASEQLLSVLIKELPWLAFVTPRLTTADPLILDSPVAGADHWTTAPLVEVVLQAMLDGVTLDLEASGGRSHNLGLASTHRFPGSNSELDTRRLMGISPALNTLIAQLPGHYHQAQVNYWRGQSRSSGKSRDQWLQSLMKMAMISNLPLQNLDEQQQACIRGLLRGGSEQPSVFVVQVTLSWGEQVFTEVQSGLLVTGNWDEREVILWCSPSSQILAFDSMDDFAGALRDQLALRYHFSAISWERYELEGNAFSQWVALLLDGMLERIGQLRLKGLTLEAFEGLYETLSDPAQWWIAGYFIDPSARATVPPGIGAAKPIDSFSYQDALLDLALDQADAGGKSALDGILDLHSYARRALREQLLKDYPAEANYLPDEVIVHLDIAQGIPGGAGAGTGGGEPLVSAGTKTLTEFAIANLSALDGVIITRISHSKDQLIMPWLDAKYIKALVGRVDIGGRYPRYVADAFDDPQGRVERCQLFAREWRQSLRFSALQAKLEGRITEAGLQCVVDLCKGNFEALQDGGLMPLSFKRSSTSTRHDLVQGMYLLFSTEPSVVLLYRPLYPADSLRQFSSFDDVIAQIRLPGALQESILTWMNPDAGSVYEHGGFAEPHIIHIGQDPYQLPDKPEPAQLDLQLWQKETDERLYVANRNLLIELADRESTSNAQSRWAILGKGAWLLFHTVSLLARGPVAAAAWLVQEASSLQSEGATHGDEFERESAIVDLIVNLGMTLLHARLPGVTSAQGQALPSATAFDGPLAQDGGFASAWVVPEQGKVGIPGPLKLPGAVELDFSWRGNQGFNWLAPFQREALRAMRSNIVLEGLKPSPSGVYEQDGQQYISLLGEVFAVEETEEGVQIVDAAGQSGPWLVREQGGWRIDTRLRLMGGAPKVRLGQQYKRLEARANSLTAEANEVMGTFDILSGEVIEMETKIEQLGALKAAEHGRRQKATQDKDETFDMKGSDKIMDAYEKRIAELDLAQDAKRLQTVTQGERLVALDREQCEILQSMLEPKYGNYRETGFERTLQVKWDSLMAGVIRHSEFILEDLQYLVNFPRMRELAAQFDGGVTPQLHGQYRAFRSELENAVAIQERMLVAQGGLDQVLVQVPDTFDISMGNAPRSVGQLIAGRLFTTVDLRFHHVMNLADLALHLDGGSPKLIRYREALASDALRSAGTAHGESLMANLSVADRISILQEAWDAYAAAIIDALHLERTGGKLVEVSKLERYRKHLQLLKEDAGRLLMDALAEQDGLQEGRKRVPYPRSSAPQRAIRNRDGLLVIATQAGAGLEVQDPISKESLQIFDLKDGEYVQREDDLPEPVYEGATEADSLIQALLEDNKDVLAIAEDYVRDDANGQVLDRLLQRQIKRLRETMKNLTKDGADAQQIGLLDTEVTSMQARQVLLLTELYSKTRYPTAHGLRFLHDQGLIKVDYIRRDTSVATSPFDEFRITRLNASGAANGRAIWAAHFHLEGQASNLDAFTYAHLKLWSQRYLGRQYEAASGNRVHRGRLTAEDIQGIIPLT